MVTGQKNKYLYYWDTLRCYFNWLKGDLKKFLQQFVTKNIISISVSWKENMYDDEKLYDLNNMETEDIQKAQLIVTEASKFT